MIAAGVGLFDLARVMRTRVEQPDKVYGHLLAHSLERARTALDTYIARRETQMQTPDDLWPYNPDAQPGDRDHRPGPDHPPSLDEIAFHEAKSLEVLTEEIRRAVKERHV